MHFFKYQIRFMTDEVIICIDNVEFEQFCDNGKSTRDKMVLMIRTYEFETKVKTRLIVTPNKFSKDNTDQNLKYE